MVLSWIAPRGIVAAAVSALFALKLEQQGYVEANLLVSLTFMVIIGTVVFQSATGGLLGEKLGVANPESKRHPGGRQQPGGGGGGRGPEQTWL